MRLDFRRPALRECAGPHRQRALLGPAATARRDQQTRRRLPPSIADQRRALGAVPRRSGIGSPMPCGSGRCEPRSGAATTWRPSRSPISSRASSGRCGRDAATMPRRRGGRQTRVATRASLPKDSGAITGAPVGPARGDPETEPGSRSRCCRLGPRARIPRWPGAPLHD